MQTLLLPEGQGFEQQGTHPSCGKQGSSFPHGPERSPSWFLLAQLPVFQKIYVFYKCSACIYICAQCVYLMPNEVRGIQSPELELDI